MSAEGRLFIESGVGFEGLNSRLISRSVVSVPSQCLEMYVITNNEYIINHRESIRTTRKTFFS